MRVGVRLAIWAEYGMPPVRNESCQGQTMLQIAPATALVWGLVRR